jgi:hypothetical protein
MKIADFLKTVYLGDRGCKAITVDGWNSEVKVQVSCISRVRSANWDFYDAEDLPDGFLVFEGVSSIELEPSGPIPNDLINDIRVEKCLPSDDFECVVLSVDSVNAEGDRVEVLIRMVAKSMALEAKDEPDRRIRT